MLTESSSLAYNIQYCIDKGNLRYKLETKRIDHLQWFSILNASCEMMHNANTHIMSPLTWPQKHISHAQWQINITATSNMSNWMMWTIANGSRNEDIFNISLQRAILHRKPAKHYVKSVSKIYMQNAIWFTADGIEAQVFIPFAPFSLPFYFYLEQFARTEWNVCRPVVGTGVAGDARLPPASLAWAPPPPFLGK